MASLYQLTAQYKMIQELAESGEGDFSEALASIEGEAAEKLEGYAMVIKNIESDVAGLDAEIKRLTERKKSMVSNIDRMKNAMADTLLTVEGNKLQTEKFTFSFRGSEKVHVLDENLVPREFIKPGKPSVDIESIGKKLKAGEDVTGAQLVSNKNLQIK